MPQTFLAVTKAPKFCQQLKVILSSPACHNGSHRNDIQKDVDGDTW